MASLRILLLVALILLAVALQTSDAGPYGANVEDSICCQDYIRYPLPSRVVKEFFWTSKSCRKPGVVDRPCPQTKEHSPTMHRDLCDLCSAQVQNRSLITIKNRDICADPRLPWVKKILHKLA